MPESILELTSIWKAFDSTTVLQGIGITVRRGEFITLLGPSGCGKSTTLRIVAGLESPDQGQVVLNGQDVTKAEPNKRNVNTVFQNYALFPHMNVYQNIAYGLRVRGLPKPQIKAKVGEMLELVQLPGFDRRMPDQISGGQRQRVAIARAIVNDPDILLLDEPLGALDLQLRRQMQQELKGLQQRLGMTFIYVTHDQEEALNMSDRIAVMNNGVFEQIGTPDEIYERPVNRFVATFIGESNILETTVSTTAPVSLHCADGRVPMANDDQAAHVPEVGDQVTLSLRTERVRYGRERPEGFHLTAVVDQYSYIGGMNRTALRLSTGQLIQATGFRPSEDIAVGETVNVYWDPRHVAVVERGA